jgi:hypothetical protein
LVRAGHEAAEVAVFEPVAAAFEGYHLGVVDEAVDQGGCDDVVAEDLAPPAGPRVFRCVPRVYGVYGLIV